MVEKKNFMVFRALFHLKYISNQDDLLPGEALAGVLLEERTLNISKLVKKSIMAAQKCKNIVAGCIKGFLIIC